MNQQTAYIDMSNVYSVNQFEGRKILRDIAGGYLRSPTEADGRYMLLRNMDPNDGCNDPENLAANTPCFKSGTIHFVYARVSRFANAPSEQATHESTRSSA